MKVKITKVYNLQDDFDREEYELDLVAREQLHKFETFVFEFEEFLRKKVKYEDLDEKEADVYDKIRDQFYAIKNESFDK